MLHISTNFSFISGAMPYTCNQRQNENAPIRIYVNRENLSPQILNVLR